MPKLRSAADAVIIAMALAVDLIVWDGTRELRWDASLPVWVAPLLTATVFSTLVQRWRHPLPIFWVQWLYVLAVGAALPGYECFAGLLVALHAVARKEAGRHSLLALTSCALPFGINLYNATVLSGGQLTDFMVSALLWVALSTAVWGSGRAARLAELRSRRAQKETASKAVQLERVRIARELHDIVSGAVTAMHLQAATAQQLVGTEDAQVRETLALIQDEGKNALIEMDRLLRTLRSVAPSAEDDQTLQPRLEDVPLLIQRARASGLDVLLTTSGSPRPLHRMVDLTAYRIIQEGLTNCTKHAGRGAKVHVELAWTDACLALTVRDTPKPADRVDARREKFSSGVGLIGPQERACLVNGELAAYGTSDGGFVVRAELPFATTPRIDALDVEVKVDQ